MPLSDACEYALQRLLVGAAFPVDEIQAGLWVQLDGGHPGPILAAIVLLLHEEVQLVQTMERRAIFLLVVLQGLAQADERDAALVLQLIAHQGDPTAKVRGQASFRSRCLPPYRSGSPFKQLP